MEQTLLWESNNNASNGVGQCHAETQLAFEDARNKMYTADGQNEYNNVFNIEPKLGSTSTPDLDASNFLSTIFGSFQGIIQYTFDDQGKSTENKTDGLNVANLCRIMVGNGNYSQRLKQVYDWEQSWDTYGYNSSDPFDNDYWADIDPFRNTSFYGDLAYMRGWMWLSCNEFGWLQTTDNNGIFQNLIPLSFYLKQCQDMFNASIDAVYVQNQVSATFQRLGLPQNYRATNVVLPNGSLDPWSTLGCNVTVESQHQYARTTVGGAHCVDMYPYDPSKYPENTVEPTDVSKTIQLVKQEVAYYITLPSPFDGSNNGGNSNPTTPTNNNTATSPANNNTATSPASDKTDPVTSPNEGASMTSVSMSTVFLGILIYFVNLF
uniref:Serine protease n=1 Tax=Acrobeloides nanus TaxID=290746 RepID=A0A914E436_9BILA